MTTVDPVAAGSSSQPATSLYSTQATSAPEQSMDGQMFLQLLVTQLQNQDPSSPMDTDQMIEQTTQLAQMEQLTSMSQTDTENFSLQMRTSAAQMIGQQVTYENADGVITTGTASSVSFDGQVPMVNVGKDQVRIDDVLAVTAAGQTPPDVTAPDGTQSSFDDPGTAADFTGGAAGDPTDPSSDSLSSSLSAV